MNEAQETYQTDSETRRLADELGHGLESLNRATAGARGLAQPATIKALVASLGKVADGLHQTMQNIGERLIQELESGTVTREAGQAVLHAQDALAESGKQATKLERSIIRVQESLNALYGDARATDLRGETLRAVEQRTQAEGFGAQVSSSEYPKGIGALLAPSAQSQDAARHPSPHKSGPQPRPPR